jgi:hypothetical protein
MATKYVRWFPKERKYLVKYLICGNIALCTKRTISSLHHWYKVSDKDITNKDHYLDTPKAR